MTTSRRFPAAALSIATLTAALALAGCGGSSGSDAADGPGANVVSSAAGGASTPAGDDGGSSTSGAPDPCSLISAADLSSAYGVEFGEGAADTSNVASERGFKACKWADSGGTKSFILQTVASGDELGGSASDLFDQSKDIYDGTTDGGVGDKSLLLKDEGGFLAVKGDVFVQGNAIIFGGETPAGATKTVMTAVVGKL